MCNTSHRYYSIAHAYKVTVRQFRYWRDEEDLPWEISREARRSGKDSSALSMAVCRAQSMVHLKIVVAAAASMASAPVASAALAGTVLVPAAAPVTAEAAYRT